jgi:hypothetical protein
MKAPAPPAREPIEAGSHRAVCYAVIDIGEQKVEYPGKPPSTARQLRLQWELPDLRMQFEDDNKNKVDKPKVISTTYTFSTYEGSTLSQHVTPWMGSCPDDFDFDSLIGKNCYLGVIHKMSQKKKLYAKVATVMALPVGVQPSAPENPTILYDMYTMGSNYPESLSGDNYKWLRKIIEDSVGFKPQTSQAGTEPQETSQPTVNGDPAPPPEDTRDFSEGNPDDNQPSFNPTDDIPF